MAFPSPQVQLGFPLAQTGTGFPLPPAWNDPMFGVNPVTGRDMYGFGTAGLSLNQSVLQYGQTYLGQTMVAQQLAALQQAGLPLDSDPNAWTLEEAQAQTDAALAKIATVNPDLAQQLQDERTGAESGKGFWDSLVGAAGSVLKPFAAVGAKALDILIRPSHIIPELFLDEGSDPWYTDIMQALSGESKATWANVLEEWGIENSFARGTVGFVMDVLTDPVTYVTFGTGAIGTRVAAVTAGKLAMEKAGMRVLLEKGLVSSADDALKYTRQLADEISSRGLHVLGRELDEDVAAGLAKLGWQGAEREVWGDMYEVADYVTRWVNSGRKLTTLPEQMAMTSGRVYTRDEILRWFFQAKGALGASRDTWTTAKALAGAIGGVRYHFALPFTRLRFITAPIPGTGNVSFQGARRFFIGQAGMGRLVKGIKAGTPGIGWEDFVRWMDNGFEYALEKNPALRSLGGRGANFGSMFYSASESIGRVTSHFTPHAWATRTGYLGLLAADASRTAREVHDATLRGAWTWADTKTGEVVVGDEFRRRLFDVLEGNTADPRWYQFLEAFPNRGAWENPDQWWQDNVISKLKAAQAQGHLTDEVADTAIMEAEAKLATMKTLSSQVSPEQAEWLFRVRDLWDNLARDAGRHEVTTVPFWHMNLDGAKVLCDDQAMLWNQYSAKETREIVFYVPESQAGASERVLVSGLGKEDVRPLGERRSYGVAGESWGADSKQTHMEILEEGDNPRVRIKAWHATYRGAIPNTPDEIDGWHFGFGGFHMGDQAGAIDRAEVQGQWYVIDPGTKNNVVTHRLTKEDIAAIAETQKARGRVLMHPDDFGNSDVGAYVHRWNTKEAADYIASQHPGARVIARNSSSGNELLLAPIEIEGRFLGVNTPWSDEYANYFAEGLQVASADAKYLITDEGIAVPLGDSGMDVVTRNSLDDTMGYDIGARHGDAVEMRRSGQPHPGGRVVTKAQLIQEYDGVRYVNDVEGFRPGVQTPPSVVVFETSMEKVRRMNPSRVRITKALVLDQTPGAITTDEHILEAAYREAEAAADAMREVRAAFGDNMDEVWDVNREWTADEGVAEILQRQGYEGIVVKTADGQVKVTVFDPKNIKATDQFAPVVTADRGYVPHIRTKQAQEALLGLTDERLSDMDKFFGPPYLHHDLRRTARAETLDEAEMQVRRSWSRERGMDFEGPIYRRDIMEITDIYAQRFARAFATEEVSRAYRRIGLLSEVAPKMLGEPLGLSRFRFKVIEEGDGMWKQLERLDKAARKSAVTAARARVEYLDELHRRTIRRSKAWKSWLEALERGDADREAKALFGRGSNAEALLAIEAPRPSEFGLLGLHETPSSMWDLALEQGAEFDQLRRVVGARVDEAMKQEAEAIRYQLAAIAKQKGKAKDTDKIVSILSDRLEILDKVRALPAEQTLMLADQMNGVNWLRHDLGLLDERMLQRLTGENQLARQLLDEMMTTVKEAHAKVGRVPINLKPLDAVADREAAYHLRALNRQAQSAFNEMNKAIARQTTAVAQVHPALVPIEKMMTGFVPLKGIEGLEGLACPAYIAAEFSWAMKQAGSVWEARRMWRRWVMGPWKQWATFRWPGFHVRNNLGAWFNNWLGGTTEFDYLEALKVLEAKGDFGPKLARRWADVVVPNDVVARYRLGRVFAPNEQVTYGKVADLLNDVGIHRANTQQVAGVFTTIEELDKLARQRGMGGAVRQSGRWWDKKMRQFGSGTEDYHRAAAFLTGMRSTDGDVYGSRAWVMMRHGDYEDLNDFEEFVKDLIPFYKWFRVNVPYQLHNLFEAPGKPLAVIKAKAGLYETMGYDYEETTREEPAWMKGVFAFPIKPKGPDDALNLVTLDLPFADLFAGTNEYLSMFLPMVRPFIENAVGVNFFSKQGLEGDLVELGTMHPLNLPIIRDALVATGFMQRGTEGQYLVDERIQNVLSGFPVFGRFRNWMYEEDERMGLRANTIASAIFGFGLRTLGPERLTEAELSFYYDQIEPLMNQMRDMGVIFPTKDDLDPGLFAALGMETPTEEKAA